MGFNFGRKTNTTVQRKGEYKGRITLPTGVNEREKEMFLAFAKSVNQGLFKA